MDMLMGHATWAYESSATSNTPHAGGAQTPASFELDTMPPATDFGNDIRSDGALIGVVDIDSNAARNILDKYTPPNVINAIHDFQLAFEMTATSGPDLHEAFPAFFGGDEILMVNGSRSSLQEIGAAIVIDGRAMERCGGFDLAMNLLLQYGVIACDAARCPHRHAINNPARVTDESDRTPLPNRQLNMAPSTRRGKDIVPRKPRSVQAAAPAPSPSGPNNPTPIMPAPSGTASSAPASSGLAPSALAPGVMQPVATALQQPQPALSGQPRPTNILGPTPKPRGTRYSAWDNAPLFNGLSNDQILSGHVHPDDIQGTLAIQVATTTQNHVIISCIKALYRRLGQTPLQNSAITKRWTLALLAQCKRDGSTFDTERARIRAARKNGRRFADDLLLAIGPPPTPPQAVDNGNEL